MYAARLVASICKCMLQDELQLYVNVCCKMSWDYKYVKVCCKMNCDYM